MEDFLSLDHLSLILVFVVPGFITLSVRSQFITDKAVPDNIDRFLSYVTISMIYGTLVLRFVDATLYQESTWVFLLVLFGGPVCLGLLLGINIQRDLLRRSLNRLGLFPLHPSPTAWDWKFSRQDEQWVLVTLKNGDTISGFYGKESFSASNPDERDLYIHWIYDTDETGTSSSPQEKGVYISAGEISTIEFWPYSNSEESNGQEA